MADADQIPAAEIPPTIIPQNPVVVRPKPPGEYHIIPFETIHAAMLEAKGDRIAAAQALKITIPDLNGRIHRNASLRMEWSRAGTQAKALAAKVGDETQIEKQTRESLERYEQERRQTLTQIRKLDDRINKADQAREMWEPGFDSPSKDETPELKAKREFCMKYAFQKNSKGDPAEEMMVREAYVNLKEELRLCDEAIANLIHTKAKIQALNKVGKGAGRGVPGKTNFATKATMLNNRRQAAIHVHPAPGSNVLIAQTIPTNGEKH